MHVIKHTYAGQAIEAIRKVIFNTICKTSSTLSFEDACITVYAAVKFDMVDMDVTSSER